MQSCYYPANDGLNLHYLTHQHPSSDSCCLLMHGFTNDAHIFDGLAHQLSQSHSVISLDFRGHGDSEWDTGENYSHGQLVEDTYTLIKGQPYKKWHIIGHSLGARVAMLLISRHGLTPESFTIIDTGPEVRAVGVNKVRKDAENTPTTFADENAYFEYLSRIYVFAESDKVRQMAKFGLKRLDGQWVPKTDPAFTRALWKPESQQGDATDLKAPLNEELWESLANIQCPSLVIKGQASAILAKKTAEKMAHEVLPNGQLKTIPRTGHAIMVDNPPVFEQTVVEFVRAV